MYPQDLEDLLKYKKYTFSEVEPLQSQIKRLIADLAGEGNKNIVVSVFASNPAWIGVHVTVPNKDDKEKTVSVQYKPSLLTHEIEVCYYNVDEVLAF